jgi:hypothetical protein
MDARVRVVDYWHCDGVHCLRAERDPRVAHIPNIVALIPDPRLRSGFSMLAEYAVNDARVAVTLNDDRPEILLRAARQFHVVACFLDVGEGRSTEIEIVPDTDDAFALAARAIAVELRTVAWDSSPELPIRNKDRVAVLSAKKDADGWIVTKLR